jgi:hypothetical protein
MGGTATVSQNSGVEAIGKSRNSRFGWPRAASHQQRRGVSVCDDRVYDRPTVSIRTSYLPLLSASLLPPNPNTLFSPFLRKIDFFNLFYNHFFLNCPVTPLTT